MSFLKNLKKRYARATPKQFVLSGVFMLALAGAIGGGFAAQSNTTAATVRDCSFNSILNKDAPRCGALTAKEFIADVKANREGDLKKIFADSRIGLQSSEYNDFEKKARHGVITKSGKLIVDGQTVMTDVWTMGRTDLGGSQRTPIYIDGKKYYHSHPSVSFGSSQLDAMVLFDKNGTVEFGVLEACGNPVTRGNKVKSGAKCKDLNKHAVSGKKNTYRFSTDASKFGLAKYVKFKYYYNNGSGDKLFDTTSSPSEKTKEITFTKSATVKVKIEISLPGKQTKIIVSKDCETKIGVVKEKFLYVCDALVRTEKDNRIFRFTVHTKQTSNVTVNSADFTLDGDVTTKNVTTKDADGNIYKEYDFSDNKEHTVSVIVNFTADGKKVTSKEGDCVAKVLPEEIPECPEKPGSGLPPGHPECEEEPELPETGAAGVAGLFAGVTVAGAAGHRLYSKFRGRRSE